MEFVELETKEEIMTAGALAREIAPSVLAGEALEGYLSDIEHKIRRAMEKDTEYYLICRQGPVGYAALVNRGDFLEVTEMGVVPACRNQGILKRTLSFLIETYDPPLIRIRRWGGEIPAFEKLGYVKNGDDYEKRFYSLSGKE